MARELLEERRSLLAIKTSKSTHQSSVHLARCQDNAELNRIERPGLTEPHDDCMGNVDC